LLRLVSNRLVFFLPFFVSFLLGSVCQGQGEDSHGSTASSPWEWMASERFPGGISVWICSSPLWEELSFLTDKDSTLLHVLTSPEQDLQSIRGELRDRGLHGRVTVSSFAGEPLPFVQDLVNVLVLDGAPSISSEEASRVVRPLGTIFRSQGDTWNREEKPWPLGKDCWTHYLYDATNNAVSRDLEIAPMERIQWMGSPVWTRHHEHMSSVTALVSAKGRLYSIMDMAPVSSIQLPPQWRLVARDAFNGIILWSRDLPSWHTHLWPLKSGPATLPRRLVAVEDSVYATVGIRAGLSELDGRTGELVREYDDTLSTEEILWHEGVLYLLVNRGDREPQDRHTRDWGWDRQPRWLVAMKAASGEKLWEKKTLVAPLTLAVHEDLVVFHDGAELVAWNREKGEESWKQPVKLPDLNFQARTPTLVLSSGVVLFVDGKDTLSAFSAQDGHPLWQARHPRTGHGNPLDLFVIDGLAWAGEVASGQDTGLFEGRDLMTGEVVKSFLPNVETSWFHHRCYRAKATERYILTSRTGVEFIDLETENWVPHHFVRGGCLYGILPANGMIYAPAHSCACFMESKINGWAALAPGLTGEEAEVFSTEDAVPRLEKATGLSVGEADLNPMEEPEDAWPTYRHDSRRSGHTERSLDLGELGPRWRVKAGERLTALTAGEGRIYVCDQQGHEVRALDSATGELVWRYLPGASVDSPPTLYQGRLLFGARDGWVYCLSASDGHLIWRFRVGPKEMMHGGFEALESVWPCHGSVLVEQGVAYCLAGRSMFFDGGLRLCRLDALSGELLSETVMDRIDPFTDQSLEEKIQGLDMPVALPDILVSDGRHVYMRSQVLDMQGNRVEIPMTQRPMQEMTSQREEYAHIFPAMGFLDDEWHHRSYWSYGHAYASGCNQWFYGGRFNPAGRILVMDENRVYGFGRKPSQFAWVSILDYELFSATKELRPEALHRLAQRMDELSRQGTGARGEPPLFKDWTRLRVLPRQDLSAVEYEWIQEDLPLLVRAMVSVGRDLVVAGPRNLIREGTVYEDPSLLRHKVRLHEADLSASQDRLREQTEALEGKRGGILQIHDKATGKVKSSLDLDTIPVFDGMISYQGRLYLSMVDGTVVCMAGSIRQK